MARKPKKDWLEIEMDSAEREVKRWPKWMKKSTERCDCDCHRAPPAKEKS